MKQPFMIENEEQYLLAKRAAEEIKARLDTFDLPDTIDEYDLERELCSNLDILSSSLEAWLLTRSQIDKSDVTIGETDGRG